MDLNDKAFDSLADVLRGLELSTRLARLVPCISFISLPTPNRTTFCTQIHQKKGNILGYLLNNEQIIFSVDILSGVLFGVLTIAHTTLYSFVILSFVLLRSPA